MGNTASSARNDHGKTRTSAEAAAASHLSAATAGERNNRSSSRGRGERKPFGAPVTETTTESVVTSVAAGGAASTTTNANAAEESAAATAQRLKQTSVWSLGSLSGRLNWSFTGGASRNSFHGRNRSARKSTTSLQHQRRSKTVWHKPITNTIFSTHFKESSRNEEFRIEQLIAKGAFGVVFKVIDKTQRSGETPSQSLHFYALKVLKKSKVIEENSVQQIKEEADIQKLCGHHPFIVQQIDLWQNRRNLHILSEYVPNGELFTKITAFSIELVRLYLAEIALAVDFLHNAGIIYRDAKPENILLTGSYHIKLIDFGLSKWLKLGATTRTMCGTFQYMVFDLTMEGRQVDEAVASIFHTVLFHRCLGKYMYTGDVQYSIGTVGYTDVDCDFIDFTYVCCTSDSLHRTVKRAINLFSEKLRSNESCGSGQISLEFFQKKKSRWPFQQECIPWEVWTIHLDLIKYENEDDRQMCRENVSDLLTEKVIYITELMNRHDYVPKTPSQSELDLIFDTSYPDIQPYLFKFDYSTTGSVVPSVGNAVKKMIKETLAL